MKHRVIFLQLLSFLILSIGCSDTQNHTGNRSEDWSDSLYSQDSEEEYQEPFPYSCPTGDINNDGIKDSICHMLGNGKHAISFFLGKGDSQYTPIKEVEISKQLMWDELAASITGDTVDFRGYGIHYYFKYRDNDFYLCGYGSFTTGESSYQIDLEKNELTLFVEYIHGLKKDTTVKCTFEIPPHKKPPHPISIEECFKSKYVNNIIGYDNESINAKIDSLVPIINAELHKDNEDEEENENEDVEEQGDEDEQE